MKKRNLTLITLGLLAYGLLSNAYAETPILTYSYENPYVGGATLTIYNKGTNPATISKVKFSTNATIAGNGWGTLWSWQSTLISQADPNGIDTNYTLQENPVITIEPNQSASLSYGVEKVGGPFSPFNVAIGPTEVTITLKDDDRPVIVSIDGKCIGVACQDPGNGKRIMGYYPNWAYWRHPKFLAEDLPFNKINTVAYAFSIFDKNGNISLYDNDSDAVNVPALTRARQRYPYLNVSLSFGGWSWASTPPGWSCEIGASPYGPAKCFSQLAADPKATAKFISNSVKAMKEVHFNGIDIDWEYPQPAEIHNYINLLQGLRDALDQQGRIDKTHYYLTTATSAAIDKLHYFTSIQWQAIVKAVDYVDVMTYDFHGAWDEKSNFMSAMALDPNNDPTYNDPVLGKYNVTDAINIYINAGVPTEKIIVGSTVYGRMMNISSPGIYQGLYQPITGLPQGEWDNSESGFTGVVDYKCIVDRATCRSGYILPNLTLVDFTKNSLGKYSKVPWGYSDNLFITYDDVSSTILKAKWIQEKDFAGIMLWDLSGDFSDNDPRSLVNVIYQTFNSIKNK